MQNQEFKGTATSIRTELGTIIARYHSTDIVKFNGSVIQLNTGGWKTATTKNHMNQISNEYMLGFNVYAIKGLWYVSFKGETFEFKGDTLSLNR